MDDAGAEDALNGLGEEGPKGTGLATEAGELGELAGNGGLVRAVCRSGAEILGRTGRFWGGVDPGDHHGGPLGNRGRWPRSLGGKSSDPMGNKL